MSIKISPNARLTCRVRYARSLQRPRAYLGVPLKNGAQNEMWFLAGTVMLMLGAGAAIAGGGESHGAITPANIALVAAILSLLILPAERSVRR